MSDSVDRACLEELADLIHREFGFLETAGATLKSTVTPWYRLDCYILAPLTIETRLDWRDVEFDVSVSVTASSSATEHPGAGPKYGLLEALEKLMLTPPVGPDQLRLLYRRKDCDALACLVVAFRSIVMSCYRTLVERQQELIHR